MMNPLLLLIIVFPAGLVIGGQINKMMGNRIVSGKRLLWVFPATTILLAAAGGFYVHFMGKISSLVSSLGPGTASIQAVSLLGGTLMLAIFCAFLVYAYFEIRRSHRVLAFFNIQRDRVIPAVAQVLRDRELSSAQNAGIFSTAIISHGTTLRIVSHPSGCWLSLSGQELEAEAEFLRGVATRLKETLEANGEYVRLRVT